MQFKTYLLGLDIGSSSVKASIIDADTGRLAASAQSPKDTELLISAPQPGFAEQHPDLWWEHSCAAIRAAMALLPDHKPHVGSVGISYQMHGLVALDASGVPVCPAIIWCDGRAAQIGKTAFEALGSDYCFDHLLNSPGNFTASKLAWIKQNQPEIFKKIHKIVLPGDYIAYKLTDRLCTSASGLSEGTLWDFEANRPAFELLNYWQIDHDLLATIVPTFGPQGRVSQQASVLTGLPAGTPISYRAGDQPNNAWSLGVLDAGQIAATAGTSGVIYAVSDQLKPDRQSRTNAFMHVNHQQAEPRIGNLLCLNGTGSAYSWLRRQLGANQNFSYQNLNDLALGALPGSQDLLFYPFGNGAERMLHNQDPGASFKNLRFNTHTDAHLARAVQEGIVFALCYGLEQMKNEQGVKVKTIRAGKANMFLSPLFLDTIAAVSGATIEFCDTDGAQGAARGAGLGAGLYASAQQALDGLEILETKNPDAGLAEQLGQAKQNWTDGL